MSFNSTSCVLSGTAEVETVYDFTVTATNSVGSSTASFSVSSLPVLQPPVLSFSSSNLTINVYTSFTTSPSQLDNFVSGTDSCSIAPAPPTGVIFNTTTCVLQGYPTVSGSYSFTVTATNTVGSVNFPLNLSVIVPLSYTSTASTGLVGKPFSVTPSQAGTYTNCESTPTLPSWASLNPVTCVVSGTPDAALAPTNYTITATHATGTHSSSLQMRVLASALRINPNSSVNDIHVDGDHLYVAGSFTHFNLTQTSHLAITKRAGCDSSGCLPLSSQLMASFNGSISAVISDGAGGFYVGGLFSVVGTSISNLAHVLSTGEIDLNFRPNPNGTVRALAYENKRLWVGGAFSTVNGVSRTRFAIINAVYATLSGEVVAANSNVNSIALDGQYVYLGGDFTTIQGQGRTYLARLERSTHQLEAMNLSIDASVQGVRLEGTNLYLRGSFTLVGGLPRSSFAEISLVSLTPTSLSLGFGAGSLQTWAFRAGVVYLGGTFTQINGVNRDRLGALDLATGTLTAFNPSANGTVFSLFIEGDRLIVGGGFTTILGQTRPQLVEINLLSTTLEPLTHYTNQNVSMVASSGSLLLFASSVTQNVRYSNHSYLARINLLENEIEHMPLNINAAVAGVLTDASRVYLRGSFTTVNALARENFAYLDKTNMALMGANYVQNGTVNTFTLAGSKLYIGGSFTSFGGFTRNRLAVIDTATFSVTAESVNFNNTVTHLAASPNYLYAGGSFTTVNGTARSVFASLNLTGLTLQGFSLATNPTSIRDLHYSSLGLVVNESMDRFCDGMMMLGDDDCDMYYGYGGILIYYSTSRIFSEVGGLIQELTPTTLTGESGYIFYLQRQTSRYQISYLFDWGLGYMVMTVSNSIISRNYTSQVNDVEEYGSRTFLAGQMGLSLFQ